MNDLYARYGRHLDGYPWDQMTELKATASKHGLLDLSIGTPVDPTPRFIQEALASGADSHGYPTTAGTPALRQEIASWHATWRGAMVSPEEVLPTVGSKELVAWLPTLLGLNQLGSSAGKGLAVAGPTCAYPTYQMGATIAGVDYRRIDARDIAQGASLDGVGLVWLNSPANPTGEMLDVEVLRDVVHAAREASVVVASDECYALLNWESEEPAVSLLDPRVCGGDHTGLLSVYSLSKQSNLAGYRAAFVAGDARVIADMTTTRKHAGMMVPGPVQTAMVAALKDGEHVRAQKARYRARRDVLKGAIEASGLRVDHSHAGLYLWCTRDEDCWTTLERLAQVGILAGPGVFYGEVGSQHVRVALTGTDETINEAAHRLTTMGIS